MPWIRPTLKQLFERIARDFSGRLQDGQSLIETSAEAVLARIWAGAAHLMHGFLAWTFLQVFADTAEAAFLERWARIWGIYRKAASLSRGPVSFPAADGRSIVAGTMCIHPFSGLQYQVEETAIADSGTIIVTVASMTPGSAGNLSPGAELRLVSPLNGVTSQGVVIKDGITGGSDEESDESLRSRLLERLRKPPRGGAKHDYEAWAREVPGVTRAWCYPMGNGIGTVSLCFVCDEGPDGPIPSPELVSRVQEHVDALKPATVKEFEAFAPEVMDITIDLRLTPDTDEVRHAVSVSLAGLIGREGMPDKVIPLTHVAEAISTSPGEEDHKLLQPTADIHIPPGCFPVLRDVRFEEVAG